MATARWTRFCVVVSVGAIFTSWRSRRWGKECRRRKSRREARGGGGGSETLVEGLVGDGVKKDVICF